MKTWQDPIRSTLSPIENSKKKKNFLKIDNFSTLIQPYEKCASFAAILAV